MTEKFIAIIDDEPDVRETITELIISYLDVKTVNYSSVDEFLERLDAQLVPSIVISDIHMPTGSGLRVTTELDKRKLNIPIIYISSMIDMIPRKENITILRKPIIVDDLINTIKKLL